MYQTLEKLQKMQAIKTIVHYLGNTWALCGNGTGAIGCGDQETFRNCADIRIMSHFGHPPNVQLNRPAPNAVFTRDSNNPFGRAQLGTIHILRKHF